jgi:hypothetical protein
MTPIEAEVLGTFLLILLGRELCIASCPLQARAAVIGPTSGFPYWARWQVPVLPPYWRALLGDYSRQ